MVMTRVYPGTISSKGEVVSWSSSLVTCVKIIGGGLCNASGPLTQLAYPGIKARDPCAFRAGRVVK